jgi:hypothetical protein
MSDFSDAWVNCMRRNGLPVVEAKTVEEAIDFVEKIHTAFEKVGGDDKVLIGALLVVGGAVGLDEAALAVLGQVATVAAVTYLGACILCMGSVALDDLKRLFAQGKVPDFIVSQLETDGIDIKAKA